MKPLIESLESRQLLTASLTVVTQDANALHSDSQKLTADLTTWKEQSATAVKALFKDLKKGKGGHSSKPLVQKFSSDEIAGFEKVSKDVRELLTITVRDTQAVVDDIKQILAKPTPALQTKLTADITKLKTDVAAKQATITTDAQAVITLAQKDAVSMLALSALNQDTNKAKTSLSSGLQTIMTDLTTLSTGVTKIATDAAA